MLVALDANGLTGAAALSPGQGLRVPAGLANLHNTADTFRPYDAARSIGDTSPSSPKPAKKPKCGVFGQIISIVVAVAASVFLGPVAGNLVSQGFNNIVGTQSGFSFKSLGLSVVTARVAMGLESIPGVASALQGIGKALGAGAMNAASGIAASALTQGIGVATGLQKKFGWAAVAAAGVGAGVGATVGGGTIFSNAARGIAASATESLITGKNFGDTIMANLPGIIGNTVGSWIADQVAGNGRNASGQPKRIFDRETGEEIILGGSITPKQMAAAQATAD